jgi:hypothetical protein
VRSISAAWNYFNPGRWRHSLDCRPLTDTSADGGIANHSHSCYGRRDLLKKFQPFRAHPIFLQQEARGVAARPGQAVDETRTNWIGDVHENDWDFAGRL